GSSLMVNAVNDCDADYFNGKIDLTEYHRAKYLDQALSTKFGGKFRTVNMSLPGCEPSDASLLIRLIGLYCGPPSVVIYGVAPRDFIDNSLQNPLETEHAQYLSRLVRPRGLSHLAGRYPWYAINFLLQQYIFAYQHALDFQIAASQLVVRLNNLVVPTPPGKPFTYWDRRKLLPDYHAGELYPTAMVISPTKEMQAMERFKDNTVEYIDRYRHANPEAFDDQIRYLRDVSAFCSRHDMQFIVVNMPITKKNIELLTQPRYDDYMRRLVTFSQQYSVPLLDLNDSHYQDSDFKDLVHLNGYGGKKFFDQLVDELARDPRTNAKMKPRGLPIQRQP
ncbi:MAG: hypothetical protein ACRD3W_00815, partial [Terriglobales bacterium]